MTRVFFLTIFAVLSCVGVARTSSGYSYDSASGYYVLGNDYYTRTWVSSPGYYRCGYYYPGYGYYAYNYAYTKQATLAAPAYIPYNWKKDVIQYAKDRDDQESFQKALVALGLNGQTTSVQQGVYNRYGSSIVHGDTLYGYTYQQIQQAYGSTDMNVLNQQVARNVQGAQALAGDAFKGQLDFAQQQGDNQARIAEYLARAEAAAKLAIAATRAVEPPPSSTTTTVIQGQGGTVQQTQQGYNQGQGQGTGGTGQPPGASGSGGINPPSVSQALSVDNFVVQVIRPDCGACHSGANAKGKLDLTKWASLTKAQRDVVIDRLTTRDPAKMMPRDLKDPTKPGAPLPVSHLAEFFKQY
jgi:hypothetical protein